MHIYLIDRLMDLYHCEGTSVTVYLLFVLIRWCRLDKEEKGLLSPCLLLFVLTRWHRSDKEEED